jgi:Reverse transcriptase-like
MYMNVTTVSEITNAKGDMIDPAMLNGDRNTTMSAECWQKVHQQRPDRVSWNLWKQVCKSISHKINNKWYLTQHRGKWIIPKEEIRRYWTFWYDEQNDKLYQCIGDRVSQHTRMWYDYDEEGITTDNVPSGAIPVDVERRHHAWRLKPYYRNQTNNRAPEEEGNTLDQAIKKLKKWEQELLEGITIQVQDNIMQQEITQSIKIASDGSVQDQKASFAWIISNEDGMRLATGSGPAYGCKPTSYRAEGYGILSALRFLVLAERVWGEISQCHIVCDNEAAVKQCQQRIDPTEAQPNQTMMEEWDIMAEIWTSMREFNEDRISIQHIKGHSDSKQSYNTLSLLQQLNVDADRLANEYIQNNMTKDYCWATLLPSSGVHLNSNKGTITHNIKREVKEARIIEKQIQYLCKKNKWEQETFETIAWEPHRRALNRHRKKTVTMVKYLNGIIPLGKVVSRYDKKFSAQCPSCDEIMETQEHLHRCPNPTREQWRCTFREAINKVMRKYNAPESIVQLWMEGIN